MTPLTSEQKRQLFDYCIGISSEEETAQAQSLIFSNKQASELVEKLKAILSPLDHLEQETCPDELTENTITSLKNAARSSRLKLQQLIADEQARHVTTTGLFWRNFGRILSAAAVIVLLFGIFFSPLQYARNKASCHAQLYRIGQGLVSYQNEHDDQLPVVATAAGAPWWKVGYKPQSDENCSNTRHMWLLVKGKYVKPSDFLCPGRKQLKNVNFDKTEFVQYYDFPSRNHISYSLRVRCYKSPGKGNPSRMALIADLNPLFEKLPNDFEQFTVELDKKLAKLNSNNHRGRGQNVLFWDAHVKFVKTRFIGDNADDIFTLRDTVFYTGCETPSCEEDAFLAP